jgi:hypothetical protein
LFFLAKIGERDLGKRKGCGNPEFFSLKLLREIKSSFLFEEGEGFGLFDFHKNFTPS